MCIVSYYNINLAYRASLYPIVASVIFLHINMDTDSYTKRSTRWLVRNVASILFSNRNWWGNSFAFKHWIITTNISIEYSWLTRHVNVFTLFMSWPLRHQVSSSHYLALTLSFDFKCMYNFFENLSWGVSRGIRNFGDGGAWPFAAKPPVYIVLFFSMITSHVYHYLHNL